MIFSVWSEMTIKSCIIYKILKNGAVVYKTKELGENNSLSSFVLYPAILSCCCAIRLRKS